MFGRLFKKLGLCYSILFSLDLRTSMTLESTVHDYCHAKRKIRIGDTSPVPWYTYPMIEHLLCCDLTGLNVFEFGGGYSSFFWMKNAATLRTVESDPDWFNHLSAIITEQNASITLEEDRDSYCKAPLRYGMSYDLVIIDGRYRLSCVEPAVQSLSENGLIILDNSDWCPIASRQLQALGFMRIDFSGLGPSNQFTWTTSMFFRTFLNPLLRPVKNPSSLGQISSQECDYMFKGEDS